MGTNTCSEIDLWKPKLTIRWSETKPTHKPHSANSKETNPWGWECDLILLCLMAGATTKWPHQNNRQEATPPYRENTEEFPLLRHHPCTDAVVGEQQTLAEKPHLASTLGMLRADHCICVLMVVLVWINSHLLLSWSMQSCEWQQVTSLVLTNMNFSDSDGLHGWKDIMGCSVTSPLQYITNLNSYSGGQSKLKSLIFMFFKKRKYD